MSQPLPPACYRCGRPAADHNYHGACPKPRTDGTSMFVLGALLSVVAGYFWFAGRTAAGLCASALSVLDESGCNRVTAIHDAATVGLVAGLGLVVWSLIRAIGK